MTVQTFKGTTPALASEPLDDPVIKATDLPPSVISISEITSTPPRPEDTLLGERWLCRGGAALMIGPSGIGKSSAAMQQDLCWAVGREAFGIKPARPLRIVTIQAENDRGDLYEMATGGLKGMKFTEAERKLVEANLYLAFEQSRIGERFVDEVLEPILEEYRPDIVRVDPLSAYAGADMTQADKSAALLRTQINPLLTKYNCGLILVHHTPKSSGRDTSKWKPADWSYAGAGSADIVNWARAVLVINPCHRMGDFQFIAPKRGGRIGWRDESDEKVYEKWFQHSPTSYFCWEETGTPIVTEKPPKHTVENVWHHIPLAPDKILKSTLISNLQQGGIGVNAGKAYVNQLIEQGDLIVTKEKRSGTNAAIFLHRAPHVKKSYRNPVTGAIRTVLNPGGKPNVGV